MSLPSNPTSTSGQRRLTPEPAGGAAVSVRDAHDGDWPGIWAIMQPVVRAGETYCWDTMMPEPRARSAWLHGDGDPTTKVYVAVEGGEIAGTAQLHANRPGPGAHVANASFMVGESFGGRGIARMLAGHVLAQARNQGYRSMQFNAVVENNERAVRLWESLGFRILATVPGAFRHPVHGFVGLHVMFRDL
jgi:L-amino acid N-acyltransferase YncA